MNYIGRLIKVVEKAQGLCDQFQSDTEEIWGKEKPQWDKETKDWGEILEGISPKTWTALEELSGALDEIED